MLMQEAREQIVEYGKKMFTSGLTNGTTGNISVFDKETGYMAISPSGIGYLETKPEDVVIVDLEGTIIDGDRKPSSEIHLHSEIYLRKPDMSAAVHTHSDNATIMSCLRWSLPAVHYMLGAVGGNEVRCSEYATFGTKELAEKTLDAMGDSKASFMANHGLMVCDINLAKALALVEKVNWISGLYLQAKAVGEPVILSTEEMSAVAEMSKSYGQPKK